MDKNILFGIILIGTGLGFVIYVTYLSRRIIERIAQNHTGSMREILRDLQNGEK